MSTDPQRTKFRKCLEKSELIIGGLIFGLWNNIGTAINAYTLHEKDYHGLSILILFWMFFPGIITSGGYFIIQINRRNNGEEISLPFVLFRAFILLFFYPLLPFIFCILTIFNKKFLINYRILKLLGGFLDDGPQFVLKLIIVVLYKIGLGNEGEDAVFLLSMVTSFLSLVFFGVRFNEPHSKWYLKLFLVCPMYVTSVLTRSFTLSVFLKETIHHESSDIYFGIAVLIIYIFVNIGAFKVSGQDNIRSAVFGCSSLLIPAGYNNVKEFCQRPYQPLAEGLVDGCISERINWRNNDVPGDTSNNEHFFNFPLPAPAENEPEVDVESNSQRMKSGLFLLIHNISDTFLLLSAAIYLYSSKTLSEDSWDALSLPLFLCVVPTFFFTLARAVLFPDLHSECCSSTSYTKNLCNVLVITISIILSIIGYASFFPSVLWSLIWKLFI